MIGPTYQPTFSPEPPIRTIIRLPWTPKVRQKDVDQFLETSRNKFLGYTLRDDRESLAGLPEPIHEGFRILKRVSILKRLYNPTLIHCLSIL